MGFAAETRARKVDFPAFGRPIKPTSAISFKRSQTVFSSAGTERAFARAYKTIRAEFESYGHGLAEKPEVVVLNKSDAIARAALQRKRRTLEKAAGRKALAMSGVSGEGLDDVLAALARAVEKARARGRRKAEPQRSWAP